VRKFIKEAVMDYKDDQEDFKRIEWIKNEKHPAQAICAVASVMWCSSTENYLNFEEDVMELMEIWYKENVN